MDDAELRDLRDAVNNTRATLKSLQRQARLAVQLTADLEDRLEQLDNQLLHTRQAQEAQRHDQAHLTSV